eukprot:206968_1
MSVIFAHAPIRIHICIFPIYSIMLNTIHFIWWLQFIFHSHSHSHLGNAPKTRANDWDDERTPSRCDRIIKTKSHDQIPLDVKVYDTITTNPVVMLSDHDLLYAIASYDGLNILFISWNAGKFGEDSDMYEDPHNWRLFMKSIHESTMINQQPFSPDIIFLGFQEMGLKNEHIQTIQTAVREKFFPQDDHEWDMTSQTQGFPKHKQTTAIVIWNKRTVGVVPNTGAIHVGMGLKKGSGITGFVNNLIPTKSAEIIGGFHNKVTDSTQCIWFGNAHLPVKTTKHNMGNPLRISALKDIYTKYNDAIKKAVFDGMQNVLFLLGDLNFREAIRTENGNKNVIYDQLTSALDGELSEMYEEIAPAEFGFTCKHNVHMPEHRTPLKSLEPLKSDAPSSPKSVPTSRATSTSPKSVATSGKTRAHRKAPPPAPRRHAKSSIKTQQSEGSSPKVYAADIARSSGVVRPVRSSSEEPVAKKRARGKAHPQDRSKSSSQSQRSEGSSSQPDDNASRGTLRTNPLRTSSNSQTDGESRKVRRRRPKVGEHVAFGVVGDGKSSPQSQQSAGSSAQLDDNAGRGTLRTKRSRKSSNSQTDGALAPLPPQNSDEDKRSRIGRRRQLLEDIESDKSSSATNKFNVFRFACAVFLGAIVILMFWIVIV